MVPKDIPRHIGLVLNLYTNVNIKYGNTKMVTGKIIIRKCNRSTWSIMLSFISSELYIILWKMVWNNLQLSKISLDKMPKMSEEWHVRTNPCIRWTIQASNPYRATACFCTCFEKKYTFNTAISSSSIIFVTHKVSTLSFCWRLAVPRSMISTRPCFYPLSVVFLRWFRSIFFFNLYSGFRVSTIMFLLTWSYE